LPEPQEHGSFLEIFFFLIKLFFWVSSCFSWITTFVLIKNLIVSVFILNNKFRKKNIPTDVHSFPVKNLFNNKNYIGDIAISYDIINQRSKKSNFYIEFDKIWIHGYLHLMGYDHKNIRDFNRMNKKENLILNYLNKKA